MDIVIQQFAGKFLEHGLLGLITGFLFILYWTERKERQESQDARLDNQKTLLEQIGANNVALERIAQSLDALKIEIAMRRK